MTIAPERESLEELDFPTPEVESLPTGTVVDGLVDPEMIPTLASALTPELIAAVQERTRQEIMALAPTPAAVMVRVGWERDGVVHTELVDYGILAGPAYIDRDWTCWCSPSRSMLISGHRHAELAAQQRRMRMMAGLFALWGLAAVLLMLV